MKTLKEFDYDLWAIEENGRKRYFARIKATGEEAEVSLEVMRLLLRQEKQMRREYAKQQTIGPVLSLDAIRDGGSMDEATWLLDVRQRIDSEVLHGRTHRHILQNADGQPAFDLYGMPHRGEKPDCVCCGARHQRPYGQQADSCHPRKGKNIFFLMVKIPQKNVH